MSRPAVAPPDRDANTDRHANLFDPRWRLGPPLESPILTAFFPPSPTVTPKLAGLAFRYYGSPLLADLRPRCHFGSLADASRRFRFAGFPNIQVFRPSPISPASHRTSYHDRQLSQSDDNGIE